MALSEEGMKKPVANAIMCCCLYLLVQSTVSAGDGTATPFAKEPDYIPWKLPVAYPLSASDELKKHAAKLARLLSPRSVPADWEAKQNPICCFWIEVDSWHPDGANSGFVVLIQQGGAVLRASDVEQVAAAVRAIEKNIVMHGDQVYLPKGVITSYPVIERPG